MSSLKAEIMNYIKIYQPCSSRNVISGVSWNPKKLGNKNPKLSYEFRKMCQIQKTLKKLVDTGWLERTKELDKYFYLRGERARKWVYKYRLTKKAELVFFEYGNFREYQIVKAKKWLEKLKEPSSIEIKEQYRT